MTNRLYSLAGIFRLDKYQYNICTISSKMGKKLSAGFIRTLVLVSTNGGINIIVFWLGVCE